MIIHDDTFELFVNGKQVVSTGYSWKNDILAELPASVKATLKPGKNVIAAHCHNQEGGGYVDFGLLKKETNKVVFKEAAVQKSVNVLPTQTFYTFECGPVQLNLIFTAPLLLDDLELISRPVNYLSYQVKSLDGKQHVFALEFSNFGRIIKSKGINHFVTSDLKKWDVLPTAISPDSGEKLFNSSVCSDKQGYIMAYETDNPVQFCFKFARSKDLLSWTKISDIVFTGEKNEYSACPVIRYYEPYYYVIYLHDIGRQVSALPTEVKDIQSEIENFPYQRLKKATSVVVLEAASHIASGCTGAAFNVLPMFDESLDEYEPLIKQLKERRSFFDLLVSHLGRLPLQGVQTFWNKDIYVTNHAIDSLARVKSDFKIPTTKREQEFVKAIEDEEKYNLSGLDTKPVVADDVFFCKPVNGSISSHFEPNLHHYGVDIATSPKGSVLATLDGTISFTGFDPNFGNVIQIQHKNGFLSIYKHNELLLKEVGERVKAGEAIALVGNTGKLSTGPHLHFELWYDGNPVNPEEYVAF